IKTDELLVQWRNEQLRLDRNAGAGAELDLRIQAPDIIRFILPDGDIEYIYLVASNQQTQTDHQGNQDFQMRIDRLHSVLSSSFGQLLHSLDVVEKAALGRRNSKIGRAHV